MTAISEPLTPRRSRRAITWQRVLGWAFIALVVVLILLPFFWMLRTAVSTNRALLSNPTLWWPTEPTMVNFARVLGQVDTATAVAAGGVGTQFKFFTYLQNSVIVTALTLVGQLFFSSLAAYAFARLRFPFREPIFMLYIVALMVPGIVTLIPNFVLIKSLGWLNTYQGIVAPAFLFSPFAVFFLRQFFLGLNREVEEAAKLDGASLFGIFWRIVVPLSGPALVTLAILIYIQTWNEYLWPLLVGSKDEMRVLTVALGWFRSQTPQGSPDWSGLMAGALLSALPSVLIFLALGRRAVNSIQFSGYK
jgi:multiple sugar transport system permease protein